MPRTITRPFFAYIMGSKSGVLYTGVTNDVVRRVHEHKTGVGSVFVARYAVTRLLYVEEFDNVFDAIAREKEIKGWTRKKKLDLVRSLNMKFEDLGEG